MKVKELIELLKQQPNQESIVLVDYAKTDPCIEVTSVDYYHPNVIIIVCD